MGNRKRKTGGGLDRAAAALVAALLAWGMLAAQAPAPQPAPASHRDPFKTLIAPAGSGTGTGLNLPPGRAGLVIERLRIEGIALGGPTGPVALVAQGDATYFLRPGEEIYDGQVLRLEPSAIVFRRTRTLQKSQAVGAEVTRSIAASGGEGQQ